MIAACLIKALLMVAETPQTEALMPQAPTPMRTEAATPQAAVAHVEPQLSAQQVRCQRAAISVVCCLV